MDHRPLWHAATLVVLGTIPSIATAQERWTFTPTLRIGGPDEGAASFSWVKSIAVDGQGRIFVYEHSTQDVRVFGTDGSHLKTIGRRGSGPGELRNAEGIAFGRDGKLWLRDAANGRFTRFDAEGRVEASWPARYCYSQGAWNPRFDRLGRFLDIDCMVREGRGREDAVLAYHTDMSRIDTLAVLPPCGTQELAEAATWITRRSDGVSYRQIPWAARAERALGPSGETWCAPNSARYEIVRVVPGARDTLRITKAATAVPVTRAERDSVIAAIDERGPTGLDFGRIPATKPMIERLTVDDDGRLWVHYSDARRMRMLDVYAPDGRHLATAELGRVKTTTFAPFVVRGDHLYTLTYDEDDLPWVTRLTRTRSSP